MKSSMLHAFYDFHASFMGEIVMIIVARYKPAHYFSILVDDQSEWYDVFSDLVKKTTTAF